MRPLFSFALICLVLSIPAALSARQLQIYPVAAGFSGTGKVLELTFPGNAGGLPFYVVWNTATEQSFVLKRARAGRHTYEMRNLPHWEEAVSAVAVTVQPLSSRVKRPALSDEIDMFLQPAQAKPSGVNFLEGHLLLGLSENILLMILAVLAGVALWMFRKTTPVESAVFGFLLAWGVVSLHGVYDHWTAARTLRAGDFGTFSVAGLNEFAAEASGLIGAGAWNDDLQGLEHEFLSYDLAEHGYAPSNSNRTAAFRITHNAGGGQIRWQHAGYYLVKNTRR